MTQMAIENFVGKITRRIPHNRPTRKITRVVWHHSQGSEVRGASAFQTPEEIADFHVHVRGWPSMGYSCYVFKSKADGLWHIAKCLLDTDVPSQCPGSNFDGIGVALAHSDADGMPDTFALNALIQAVCYYLTAYPNAILVCHQEAAMVGRGTDCPGVYLGGGNDLAKAKVKRDWFRQKVSQALGRTVSGLA